MDIIIANKNFERIGLIENADVVWASRYSQAGEYELKMTATQYHLDLINNGFYVIRDDDEDNVGIIEDYALTVNKDDGNIIYVTGHFADGYILGGRVVSVQTQMYGNVQDQIRNLVYSNIIEPSDPARKIDFVKLGNKDDSITERFEMQTTGDNLLEKVVEICESQGIGTKMPLRNGKLYFEMYKGIDRSYNQYDNPWVVFNDEYENLKEAEYQYIKSGFTNFAYVAGEGEGINRNIVGAYSGEEPKGIDRREIWTDQRNVSSNEENVSQAVINAQMVQDGIDSLSAVESMLDATITLNNYEYGKDKDFYLGDIVTLVVNQWSGFSINARIVEVVESSDKNGTVISLTFAV